MTNRHCYLFALEVKPMEIGGIYSDLPLHCTLMHRFWSGFSPDILADKIRNTLESTPQVLLTAHEHLLLGPKQVAVSELVFTAELKKLHMQLFELLNDFGVEYTAPEWVGDGYRAHITERKDASLPVGDEHLSKTIYLIEVEVPGHDHERLVRAKFTLSS